MDWWYFPQFLVENVCIQKKEFQTFRLKLFFFRGQRWIRTTEGVSQQIYSLPHLATLVFALEQRAVHCLSAGYKHHTTLT